MGIFDPGKQSRPNLVALSPGPSVTPNDPNIQSARGPVLLISWEGRCVYASSALATMLQCSVAELLGYGWRRRISPFKEDGPFNPELAVELAHTRTPIRLRSPSGQKEIVSRIYLVTDPNDPTTVTGFLGRVHVVRIHRSRPRKPNPQEKTA